MEIATIMTTIARTNAMISGIPDIEKDLPLSNMHSLLNKTIKSGGALGHSIQQLKKKCKRKITIFSSLSAAVRLTKTGGGNVSDDTKLAVIYPYVR